MMEAIVRSSVEAGEAGMVEPGGGIGESGCRVAGSLFLSPPLAIPLSLSLSSSSPLPSTPASSKESPRSPNTTSEDLELQLVLVLVVALGAGGWFDDETCEFNCARTKTRVLMSYFDG